MVKLRLRTKFLLSLLLVSAGVTCATLWMVGRSVRVQLRNEIAENLANSVVVFHDFQRQREINLASSAELLANLPSLKALMTTRDAATIQDASTDIWRLAPSDLFVLADPTGIVLAIHTSIPGITRTTAQQLLRDSSGTDQSMLWWFGGGHLYQVFLRPIYFGGPKDGTVLGVLGVGHEISNALAVELSHVASSEVAFFYEKGLIASTLNPPLHAELAEVIPVASDISTPSAKEIRLGDETFLATTVQLTSVSPVVRLCVLKSYDKAAAFLNRLNQLLVALGVLAVVAGSTVVFLICYTFTKPLANLVSGVHALETGDFAYPLTDRRGDEVAELTIAFDRMRSTLQRTQQELLASERLATIGRTASSISHDLRHPLTAIVANAEFLCADNLDSAQREDLYGEIRTAVDQMTDLVDSLLEFSQARESLRRVFGPVEESVAHAVRAVQADPEFQHVKIAVSREGRCEAWFDPKKVERAVVNLLLNACEFVAPNSGQVAVNLRENDGRVEIRVIDNGPGVAEQIRDRLFEPFVSYAKQNGIGLGLAIVQKICQDHGGDVCLESAEPGRTVFRLTLPSVLVPVSDQVGSRS